MVMLLLGKNRSSLRKERESLNLGLALSAGYVNVVPLIYLQIYLSCFRIALFSGYSLDSSELWLGMLCPPFFSIVILVLATVSFSSAHLSPLVCKSLPITAQAWGLYISFQIGTAQQPSLCKRLKPLRVFEAGGLQTCTVLQPEQP